jgi:tetratricopeptide (TPR) repeat protein
MTSDRLRLQASLLIITVLGAFGGMPAYAEDLVKPADSTTAPAAAAPAFTAQNEEELMKYILSGYAARQAGNFVESERIYKDAVEQAKKFGEDSFVRASAIMLLAGLYSASSRDQEAVDLYLQALPMLEKAGDKGKNSLMAVYDNLSACCSDLNMLDKAEEYNAKAMAYYEADKTLPASELAKCINNRAYIYYKQKKYDKAKADWERMIELTKNDNDPKFKGLGYDNLAMAYTGLGDSNKAYELRKEALRLFIQGYGPNHPEVAKCLHSLAAVAYELRSYAEAASYSEQEIDIVRDSMGGKGPALLNALEQYRVILAKLNRPADFAAVDKQITALTTKAPTPTATTTPGATAASGSSAPLAVSPGGGSTAQWNVHFKAAEDLMSSGKLTQSEQEYRLAQQEAEKFGPTDVTVYETLHGLAMLYEHQGKIAQAMEMAQKAVAGFKANHPEEEDRLSNAMNNLGMIYIEAGKLNEAEQILKEALAMRQKKYGADTLEVTGVEANIAHLHNERAQYNESIELYKKVLALREKAYGPDDERVTKILGNLGSLYGTVGRFPEQEAIVRRVLEADERKQGPETTAVTVDLNNLATIYMRQKKYAEAEKLFTRSLAVTKKLTGPQSIDTAQIASNLSLAYVELKRFPEAEKTMKEALAIREKLLGPNHVDTGKAYSSLGSVYVAQAKYPLAEQALKKAVAIQEKSEGKDTEAMVFTLNSLGSVASRQNKPAEAEQYYKRAITMMEKKFGPNHPDLYVLLWNRAQALKFLKRNPEADQLLKRATALKAKPAPKPVAGH